MTISPFEYIKTIDNKTEQLPIDDFNAFIINRALSFGYDTALFANEMNIVNGICNQWIYDFYYYGIPKKRRYSKWQKRDEVKDLDVIKDYYNVSFQKAIEYSKILTTEQIVILKQRLDKGGKTK
jgi:hypothetical protein